ncbi:MAG: hypothetical protein FJ146_11465 [Deltaproteobacteria bacterium]|nr:hypothetical protein [Deltaproteobacteria bacterium]
MIPELQANATVDLARVAAEANARAGATNGLRPFFIAFFGVIFPIFWVVMTLPSMLPFQALNRTKQFLKEDAGALQLFFGKYDKTPDNLNVLRSFAAGFSLPFEVYDPFGERIDFIRLDDRHFIIRSFGTDQVQNNLNSAIDIAIVSWGEKAGDPLAYAYPSLPKPEYYPAALLPGAESSSRQLMAKLFADPVSRARRLAVRHLKRDGLYMVAPHDGVEEFFWLPGSDRLVYSATGSTRYRDGLYLWNLNTDTVVNLLEKVRAPTLRGIAQGADAYWLALAGVSEKGPVVYFYLRPRHAGGLSPVEFFDKASIVAIAVPEKGKPRLANYEEFPNAAAMGPVGTAFIQRSSLKGRGTSLQQDWLELTASNDLEQLLTSWHDISEESAGTSLYPYSLWMLSNLYGESATSGAAIGVREREVLRSYGTEVARALINYPLAPSYLKGLALFNYEELMAGRPLPYKFAMKHGKATP